MAQRASFKKDFKVEETKGKAADLSNKNSLLSLNNKIIDTPQDKPGEVFDPMWKICLACANQRKLISKVRGDSNDFLNYATLGYVQRWQKQFGAPDGRRPVQYIQNWIPYILGTIRFALISFNKEEFDFDFLPLPTIYSDEDNKCDECSTRDVPDVSGSDPVMALAIEQLADRNTLHTVLAEMPLELKPFLVDILYYIRTGGSLLSDNVLNFIKIGRILFIERVERWMI